MNDLEKLLKKQLKNGLRSAGNLIARKTKQNFKAKNLPKSLLKGISAKVWKSKKFGVYVGLKKDYRLAFFEVGTKDRKTKKGYNRGKIAPNYFFKDAVNSEYNKAVEIIQKSVIDAIQ